MKIALMISSLVGGGAERVASNISLFMNDADMPIILLNDRNIAYEYCGKIITIPNTSNKLLKIFYLLRRLFILKRIKRENEIDVTFSLLTMPNIFNIFTRVKDKVVISLHSYKEVSRPNELAEKDTPLVKTIKFITKRCYKNADCLIVVSTLIRDRLISDFGVDPNRIKLIYNPVDIDQIVSKTKEALHREHMEFFSGNVFITAGRLESVKGHCHMIRAFSEAKKNIPEAKLAILGDGAKRRELENLAKELGLGESVKFLGYQSNPYKYLARASIFVLSSLHEGFSNVLVEAMACGLPVISTHCMSGPCEIISPMTSYNEVLSDYRHFEYGILCPVCDGVFRKADVALSIEESILANAMVSIANNQEHQEYYREKSIARARDFDIKLIMVEYNKAFFN